jgi:hypothetical protein
LRAAASIASRCPRFVTIGRSAPLAERDARTVAQFPKKRKRNIFAEGAGQDSCVIARRANQSIQIAQKKDFLLQP